MKKNKLIVLLTIFSILAGTTFLLKWVKNKPRFKPYFYGKEINDIVRFHIEKKDDKRVVIEKETDTWFIIEPFRYRADKGSVENFINKLLDLTLEGIISTKKDKHKNFELDEEKGIRLKLEMAQGENINFIFGKMAPDYAHIYLRFPDTEEVYLATSLKRYELKADPLQWEDKTILSFAKEELQEVELGDSGKSLKVVKEDNKWIIQKESGKIEVDNDKWNRVLDTISNLKASEIIHDKEEDDDYGFDKPTYEVKLKFTYGEGGLIVGRKKDEHKYYIKNMDTDTIFIVSKNTLDKFKKEEKDISPSPI